MIKLQDILKEIGESNVKPYKYTVASSNEDETRYNFKTDSNIKYEIEITNQVIVKGRVIVAYKPIKGSYEDETNKGEHFRIMSTVVTAVKEYLTENPDTKEITFTTPPSPEKDSDVDTRRLNFYIAYINKQLPGGKVRTDALGRIIVELPKKK